MPRVFVALLLLSVGLSLAATNAPQRPGLPALMNELLQVLTKIADRHEALQGKTPSLFVRALLRRPETLMLTCSGCPCEICTVLGLNDRGEFAPVETAVFMHILQRGCAGSSGGASGGSGGGGPRPAPGLVVDVGANVGYFSMMSASYGCRVMAFEPQYAPRLMLTASTLLNRVADRVTILPYGLSAAPGNGTVHDVGSWGLTPVTDSTASSSSGADPSASGGGGGWLSWLFGRRSAVVKERHAAAGSSSDGGGSSRSIQLMPLSALVKEDVLLLKIDTEGYEAHVLAGAEELLTRHTVHNVVIEVKRYNDVDKREMLYKLATAAGLKCVYNYEEKYGARVPANEAVDVAAHVKDVSAIILGRQHSKKLRHEDFWLRREPLDLGSL